MQLMIPFYDVSKKEKRTFDGKSVSTSFSSISTT